MFDLICLWLGRLVIISGCGLIGLIILSLIIYFLWHNFFQYGFLKIKHLFPCWQYSQEYINACQDNIHDPNTAEWKKAITITQKGRFVKFHCPSSHFGCRTEYLLIKK